MEILEPLPDQDTKSHSNLIAIMNNIEKDMAKKGKPPHAPCHNWSDGQAFLQQGRTMSRFPCRWRRRPHLPAAWPHKRVVALSSSGFDG